MNDYSESFDDDQGNQFQIKDNATHKDDDDDFDDDFDEEIRESQDDFELSKSLPKGKTSLKEGSK